MKLEELALEAHKGYCEAGRRIPFPLDEHQLAFWSGAVRAVLNRLREPSEEMIMAGIIERHDQPCPEAWKLATANIFTAMLSAIDEKL